MTEDIHPKFMKDFVNKNSDLHQSVDICNIVRVCVIHALRVFFYKYDHIVTQIAGSKLFK